MKKFLALVLSLLTVIPAFTSCKDNTTQSSSSNPNNLDSSNATIENQLTEKTVYTARELLSNIKSNTKIILGSNDYNLSDVYYLTNDYVKKQEYSEGYVISNVKNLTIEGEAEIRIDDSFADVLSFSSCENITLKGLTVGHTENAGNYDCDGSVLYLDSCNQVNIQDCNLYGCGSIGINAWGSNDITAQKTNIYDCNYSAFYLYQSQIKLDYCNIYDMTIDGGVPFIADNSNATITNCSIKNIKTSSVLISDEGYYTASCLLFDNCQFNNNCFDFLFGRNVYDSKQFQFKSCKFSNNIVGTLNQSSDVFTNCTFNNNKNGIVIPSVVGWNYEEAKTELENKGLNVSVEYTYDNLETDCKYPTDIITEQSLFGVVEKANTVTLIVSKAAITIEQIDWDIDSANGVEPDITYTNNSDKQIAYIYFNIRFYDRMGYPAYCSIRDTDERRLKVTGPINAGVTDTSYWDPIIYNSSVGAIQPRSIEVVFSDGTKQTITNTGRYWYSSSYYGGDLHE